MTSTALTIANDNDRSNNKYHILEMKFHYTIVIVDMTISMRERSLAASARREMILVALPRPPGTPVKAGRLGSPWARR